MERLVKEGKLDAVLDLTTTEICDLHTGGVMAADQERLDAALEAGIPCIISVVRSFSGTFFTFAYADYQRKGCHRHE